MAGVRHGNGVRTGHGTNSTVYQAPGNGTLQATTEANSNRICRTPGTWSGLWVRVSANTFSSATLTIRFRKNSANGNQVVSFGAGVTGIIEDLVNTDAVVSGDNFTISYSTPAGGSGSADIRGVHLTFTDTSPLHTTYVMTGSRGSTGRAFTTASQTSFYAFGQDAFENTNEEAEYEMKFRTPTKVKNLFVRALSNARTTDTIVRTRKNGADGAVSVTFGSGVSGVLEDVSNVESYEPGDRGNLAYVLGTGTGTWALGVNSVDAVTVSGVAHYNNNSGSTLLAGATNYQGLTGALSQITTETFVGLKAIADATWRGLGAYLRTNAATADSTIRSRRNAANGNMFVTFGAGVTGLLEDLTNTDEVIAGDLIDYRVIVGTGGDIGLRILYSALTKERTATFPHNAGHRPYPYRPGVPR